MQIARRIGCIAGVVSIACGSAGPYDPTAEGESAVSATCKPPRPPNPVCGIVTCDTDGTWDVTPLPAGTVCQSVGHCDGDGNCVLTCSAACTSSRSCGQTCMNAGVATTCGAFGRCSTACTNPSWCSASSSCNQACAVAGGGTTDCGTFGTCQPCETACSPSVSCSTRCDNGATTTTCGALATCAAGAPQSSASVTIDARRVFQTIDGFGVAQPGGDLAQVPVQDSAYELYCFPNVVNAACPTGCSTNGGVCDFPLKSPAPLDLAFSDLNGIGLSILRMKINAKMEPSRGVWNDDDPAQAWIMQQAALRGPVKLFASVWSPPAWMKSNNKTLGGYCSRNTAQECLIDSDCCVPGHPCPDSPPSYCTSGTLVNDQDFADFLAHAAKQYAAANGVNFYALSMANEPDTYGVPWDTCGWSSDHIASFLENNLAPTFSANQITTKVIAPEAANWDAIDLVGVGGGAPPGPYLLSTETKPQQYPHAFNRVDIVAGHTYGGNPADVPFASAAGKPIWQTEYSAHNAWDIGETLAIATQIHQGLTGAHIRAWMWFIMFGGGGTGNDRGFMWHDTSVNIAGSPAFYALGNFSKFIRPGMVNVAADVATAPSNFYVSAYKDPALGRIVIVAINANTGSVSTTFDVGIAARATPFLTDQTRNLVPLPDVSLSGPVVVPPRSIVTYVAQPPRLTSDILWRGAAGNAQVWLGAMPATANYPGSLGSDWQIQGVGDFDANDRGDILWRCLPPAPATACNGTAAGTTLVWRNGISTQVTWPGALDQSWQIAAVGDFDANTQSDILWRCLPQAPATSCGGVAAGSLLVWNFSSGRVGWTTSPGALDPNQWQVAGVGDFDANGSSDVLWRCLPRAPATACGNATAGTLAVWTFANGTYSGTTWPGTLDPNQWQVAGVGDFDGNGASDVLWRCLPRSPATACGGAAAGAVAVWTFANGTYAGTTWPGRLDPNQWQVAGVGDFDGNSSQSDILWRCLPPAPGTACGGAAAGEIAVWNFASGNYGWTSWPGALDRSWQIQSVGRFD